MTTLAKRRFVGDLEPNETVTDYFLVQAKDVRLKKNGDRYLSLVLSDRTGRLDCKMWDGVEDVVDTFDRDDFVKIAGSVQLYRERPQITIQRLRRVDEDELDIGDYLPHTKRDIGEMFASLGQAVAEMENPHLKRLLEAFLDDEDIASRFKRAPAGKSLHHAFVGGLLEHVCSLLSLAQRAAANYDFIDRDLLLTGVLLHDLGKIDELSYRRAFGYSDEGQLLGHITIVLRMIDRKCEALGDFPPKWKLLVEHLILSHHGKYEFGSPKLPMFPEALMLHYLDDLDSKLEAMRAAVAEKSGDTWTAYNPSLERMVLDKRAFLADSVEIDARSAETETDADAAPQTPSAPPGETQREPSRPAASRAPQTRSLFGERLKTALNSDAKDE